MALPACRSGGTGSFIYGVGGFCQHTTVSPGTVTTRILERWPDRVGEKIAA